MDQAADAPALCSWRSGTSIWIALRPQSRRRETEASGVSMAQHSEPWLPGRRPGRNGATGATVSTLAVRALRRCPVELGLRGLTIQLSGRTPNALPRETRPTLDHGPLERVVRLQLPRTRLDSTAGGSVFRPAAC